MEQHIIIAGEQISNGTLREVRLKISEFYTANPVYIPVIVIHGVEEGPKLFVTAAIHGDEINGIEIVRRLITNISPEELRGTLLCVPIVNVFGFYTMTRNVPERRDLNAFFPGITKGSTASRIAFILFEEIIKKCDYGIDLHTPRANRFELPHTEADLSNREAHHLARAFGASVIIDTPGHEKSLQNAATRAEIPTIVYSGGEVLRFHEDVTEKGVKGILNVLAYLEMVDSDPAGPREGAKNSSTRLAGPDKSGVLGVSREGQAGERPGEPEFSIIVQESRSVQTQQGGILYVEVQPGELMYQGDLLARVTNPFGKDVEPIKARETGLVISTSTNPLVNPGNEVCSYVRLDKSLGMVEKAMQKKRRALRLGESTL